MNGINVDFQRVEMSAAQAESEIREIMERRSASFAENAARFMRECAASAKEWLGDLVSDMSGMAKQAVAASMLAVVIAGSAVSARAEEPAKEKSLLTDQEIAEKIENSKDAYDLTCQIGSLLVQRINERNAREAAVATASKAPRAK